jgi:DNA-binding NtrC family response regulator
MATTVLVIDDEKSIRSSIKEILEYEKMEVLEAPDGSEGLRAIKDQEIDLVLCDIKMPKMDGTDVLDGLMMLKPEVPIIMISGHGSIETAVDALKKGAFDFIEKPIDLNRLLVSVRHALDRNNLVAENQRLKKKIAKKSGFEIIGESKAINQVKELIDKVADTDARVLITGPNGSGKELVARQLHEKSSRKKAPFIEVNCAAIPAELIESELFGHEKGAFTSAVKQRKGKFELAEGGTLFLDEIGDMAASAQAKVLRALQENKITRVGGDKDINVNVRVVAATNKNLKQEIAENNFREDLYHRLSVIPIHVPSLNERQEDIPVLTDFFLKQICDSQGSPVKGIDSGALKLLTKHNWTGNIRELRNVVERLVILSESKITTEDVKRFVIN